MDVCKMWVKSFQVWYATWTLLQYGMAFDMEETSFRAAVLDKGRNPTLLFSSDKTPSRKEALQAVQPTLDMYGDQAADANSQGVLIIVFPEYGIYPSSALRTRDTLRPFLEAIPDPRQIDWNPCLNPDPDRFPDTEIQRNLSCIARQNSLYLVANMGDVIPCNRKTQRSCPPDGRYQHNTNVAYDPSGKLVARYHKYNLYFEFHYDPAPTPEYSYFDTPFGRVGTFICFDLLFKEPAISLIENHNISIIAFPTAWMNVLPYFSAVPMHQAFAIGNGVNFLSSNLHDPPNRFSGSGIFNPEPPNFTAAFRNDETSMDSALLVANLQIKPNVVMRQAVTFQHLKLLPEDQFTGVIFGDTYNFIAAKRRSGEIAVCHNNLCCYLDYNKDKKTTTDMDELFALGAFSGLHKEEGTYYLEMCVFVRCPTNSTSTCGQDVRTSSTPFSLFNMTGNFSTPYVYPMLITDNIDPASGQWTYDGRSIISRGTRKPLVSATMLGRRYDLDSPALY